MRGLACGCIGLWLWLASTAAASWLPETVRIGRLAVARGAWSAVLSHVEVTRRPGAATALSVERIEGPAGTIPLWASLRLVPRGTGWRMAGVIASGRGELVLRFEGTGKGASPDEVSLAMEKLRFTPGGLQPGRLWSPLREVLSDARGSIDLALDWQRGAAGSAGLTLAIEGIAFATPYGPVGPIDGTISLDRLWPPRTAAPQALRIEGLEPGLMVERLAIPDLSIEGILDADLAFSFTEAGRLYLEASRIAARGPGVIRYRPAEPPPFLTNQGANVDLLVAALADFHYDAATLTVEGFLDGDIDVALHLEGGNPELYEGHPIELNLDLEAPILGLVAAGRNALELPDRLRQALQDLVR